MQVYLSEHIAPSAYARLARHFEIVDNFDHPEQLAAMIIRRAVVPRTVIARAPNLKVIAMHGVSRDTIDTAAAAECAAWGYEQVATLPELFHRSDFVNVSITLCDATRDLINAPVFAAANPDLLLVNTSRGGIVNEHDLYIALTTGQIRAAASDVFVHEPPACDDPLIHLDNFIATFHIGGSTYESLERVSNRAVDYVFEYTGVPEQKEVIGS